MHSFTYKKPSADTAEGRRQKCSLQDFLVKTNWSEAMKFITEVSRKDYISSLFVIFSDNESRVVKLLDLGW